MCLLTLTAFLFQSFTTASQLYAASYAGTVTSLGLSKHNDSSYQLTALFQTYDCGPSPSWLTLDGENDVLYCLDEGIDRPNATLTSFKPFSNGTLTKINQLQIPGPVASAFYTAAYSEERFMAVAHYSSSALTTYTLHPLTGHFTPHQTIKFSLSIPGPIPSRQDAPHPHGVVVDPKGQFLLIPDLGADLVRIFHINPVTGWLTEQESLVVAPGSGPRHAVFWVPEQNDPISQPGGYRLYLVTELDNTPRGYEVVYPRNNTIQFSQFFEENTFGGGIPPPGGKAAEIAISPANTHILVSNRNDTTFGPRNDSISDFSCIESGKDSFTGLYPAYGSFPRHFEFSPDGGMLAVALQDEKIVIAEWDAENGAIGEKVAEGWVEGEVTAVIWEF
ncbi:hypothetical protein BDV12DRAFT_188906 [Aspergillus spectabilis]